MNKLYYIAFIIITAYSCNSKSKLDGIWIGAYKVNSSENGTTYAPVGALIEIKNNTITMKNLAHPSFDERESDNTSTFRLEGDSLIIESESNPRILEIISTSEDSLVIRGFVSNEERLIFKRIRQTNSPIIFELINKAFVLTSSFYNDSIDFISDSKYLHIGDLSLTNLDYWYTTLYKELTFLVIGHKMDHVIFLVKSVNGDVIHLESYQTKIFDFVLTQIKQKNSLSSLTGLWNEVSRMPPQNFTELSANEIEGSTAKLQLLFSKDSLGITRYGKTRNLKWKSNSTNQFIYFTSNRHTGDGTWKIINLTEVALVIKRDQMFTRSGETEIIEFIKVKAGNIK